MANRQTAPLNVADFNPQAQPVGQLATVPRQFDGSQATATVGAISEKLAQKFGMIADQAAAVEGERAGDVAGQDPNFRPTGSTTIRGRATDQAATTVYASNLTAKLSSDMADAYAANKDDPAAFTAAARQIQQTYQQDHVFPEVQKEFNERIGTLALAYRTKVTDNYTDKVNGQNRAALIGGLDQSQTSRAQIIAGGGDPAAVRRQVGLSVADDEARIDGLVSSNAITPEEGVKQKLAIRHDAASSVIVGEASRLKTPDEIDAYRTKLTQDFAAGKVDGLDGDAYEKLNAGLERMSKSLRTGSNEAANELKKQFDDLNERQANGYTPTAAEWATLTMEAQGLGPRGQQLLDDARVKAGYASQIALNSTEKSQAQLDADRDQLRSGPTIDRTALKVPASANIGKVNPELVDILQEAASRSGMTVSVTPQGGANRRRAGTTNHPTGHAIDVQLYDENGAPIKNFQNAASFRTYEKFAQLARKIQQEKHPDLNDAFRWGGYFGDAYHGDLMHFDISGRPGLGMAGGSWKAGLTADQREAAPGVESEGIDGEPLPAAGGILPQQAKLLEYRQQLIDKKRKAETEDPLGVAATNGIIPAVKPFDPSAPDADQQLGTRVSQAQAVAQADGRAPVYLRPDEKTRLSAALGQGGDEALGVLQRVVSGGREAAPTILKELGTEAPVMAQAGAVLASGGSLPAVRDAMTAIKMKKDGSKLPDPPKTMMTLTADTMGRSLDSNLEERGRITQLADLIYAARMTRTNTDRDSTQADDVYRRALQEASGAVFTGGEQYGGFAEIGGGLFGSRPRGTVALPPGMSATLFPKALDAIRDEDLKNLKVPPVGSDGKPYTAQDLVGALPVRFGAGYRFQVADPQTGDPAFIRGQDGRPFVLPIEALKDIATYRRVSGDLQ